MPVRHGLVRIPLPGCVGCRFQQEVKMRTLDSEELKLVYGGGGGKGDDHCKGSKSRASHSKSRSRSKTRSHHDHGKHKGWCHKKD